jgi:hypothetical protein
MGIRDRPISPRSPLAKSVCRASDWYRAARVPGPGADLRRGAPAANSFFVCGLTMRCAHTWRLAKTRHRSGSPAVRRHCRYPNLVRAAPPLCPDTIFGKDRGPRIRVLGQSPSFGDYREDGGVGEACRITLAVVDVADNAQCDPSAHAVATSELNGNKIARTIECVGHDAQGIGIINISNAARWGHYRLSILGGARPK